MPQNFNESRGEQGFLLPPDMRDWLPSDHLAWFVVDAVAGMNLVAFYGAYRENGQGRPAYDAQLTRSSSAWRVPGEELHQCGGKDVFAGVKTSSASRLGR